MQRKTPKVIIVFGEMASGKSTAAKELAYRTLKLEKEGFFEGDDVLNLPELKEQKSKVGLNQPLTHSDVEKLVDCLIDEIKKKSTQQSTIVVSQALYLNKHRKKIQSEFGENNTYFIWVKTSFITQNYRLFLRERAAYLLDNTLSTTSSYFTRFQNQIFATWHGVKSIATNIKYSQYFEKPSIDVYEIDNSSDLSALSACLKKIPITITTAESKFESTAKSLFKLVVNEEKEIDKTIEIIAQPQFNVVTLHDQTQSIEVEEIGCNKVKKF